MSLSPATLAVTAGRPPHANGNPVNTPPHLTSIQYSQGTTDAFPAFYARYGNETWDALEEVVGLLEGASHPALAFASGMAAIDAVFDEFVGDGDVLVVPSAGYLAMKAAAAELGRRHRVEVREVDVDDTDAVLAALDGARLLWLESPTNPLLQVADVPAVCAAARERGVLTAVDNTFATPLGMRPLELGADIVVHSATKFLAGHSDVIAGVAVTNDPDIRARLHARRTVHGPILGPMETWLTLRGIRTLAVRVREACRNAELLAHRLADHPAVAAVRHPSLSSDPGHARAAAHMDTFGSIIGIQLGTAERADDVISRLQVWTPGTSLGGVESLIERRRRLRGESVLVPVDFVRLSVGIEDVEDLWSDLTHALA